MREIVVQGVLQNFPSKTLFLYNVQTQQVLDSTSVLDGKFRFTIRQDESFEPLKVGLSFISQDGNTTYMSFHNKYKGENGNTSFFLESGTIDISGSLTSIEHHTSNRFEINAGKETDLFYKYDGSGFGHLYGSNPGQLKNKVNTYVEIIRNNSGSHYLIEQIYEARSSYDEETLSYVLKAFDSSLSKSRFYKNIEAYLHYKNKLGQPLQKLIFKDTEGNTTFLPDSSSHLNVYVFWASWCGPCIKEIPVLKELHTKYAGKGVRFKSISTDTDRNAWEKAVREQSMPWEQYIVDSANRDFVKYAYDFNSIPVVFFISPEGVILSRVNDYGEDRLKIFTEKIESYLASKQ